MRPQLQIVRQHQQESPFLCSACGADRGCDCNAPAVERLREIRELDRQKKRAQREREKVADGTRSRDADVENIEENAARAHTEIRVPSPVTSDVVEDALDLVRHMTCRQWQRFIYLLDINEWLPTKGTQEGDAILDAGRKQMERNSEH